MFWEGGKLECFFGERGGFFERVQVLVKTFGIGNFPQEMSTPLEMIAILIMVMAMFGEIGDDILPQPQKPLFSDWPAAAESLQQTPFLGGGHGDCPMPIRPCRTWGTARTLMLGLRNATVSTKKLQEKCCSFTVGHCSGPLLTTTPQPLRKSAKPGLSPQAQGQNAKKTL